MGESHLVCLNKSFHSRLSSFLVLMESVSLKSSISSSRIDNGRVKYFYHFLPWLPWSIFCPDWRIISSFTQQRNLGNSKLFINVILIAQSKFTRELSCSSSVPVSPLCSAAPAGVWRGPVEGRDGNPGRDGPAQVQDWRGRQQAEWRPLIGPELSRYCALIGWDHGVATPALLCYKDTAQDTQHFHSVAVSLWHKGCSHAGKGSK